MRSKKDLFDELAVNVVVDTYLDDLGECLERKKKELSSNAEYSIPAESLHYFTKKYNQTKIKSTLLRPLRQHLSTRKVACFLGLIVVVFTLSVSSMEALRIPVLNFLIEQKETFTHIQLKVNEQEILIDLPKEWDNWYAPRYIPSPFTLSESTKYSNMGELVYADPHDNKIFFTFDFGNTSLALDTEDATITDVLIKNSPGKIISKEGYHTIAFAYQGVFFTVAGEIPQRELVKIAESIEK